MVSECSVLILAGGLNPTPLQGLMGFPVAGLPVSRERTLLSAWLAVISESLGSKRGSTRLLCGTVPDEQWFIAELRRAATSDLGVEVRRDGRPHRGVCGLLADTAAECDLAEWVLVIELTTLPPRSLEPLLGAATAGVSMVVGSSRDARPAGAILLRRELLKDVPKIGYLDLKEQFLPQLVARGHRIEAAELADTAVRMTDRRNYLRSVRIWQSENDVAATAPNIAGHSVVAAGVELAEGAFVLDSVILPGASIGPRCVVARSIVGPLIRLPEGSVLVDAVMANPRLGDRPTEFRVSSGISLPESPKDAVPLWSR